MRRRAAVAGVLLVAALLLAGVASGPEVGQGAAAPGAASLSISFRDGAEGARRAVLRCRPGGAEATGFLRTRGAVAGCRRARRLAAFLASRPDARRVCALVYGGPQTARIRGTIEGRAVNRLFSRRDGCQVVDWNRVSGLLPVLSATRPAPPSR